MRMLETQLHRSERKESEINLKFSLPLAVSFEMFWQVSLTDCRLELLPIALKSYNLGGRAQVQT